MSAVAPCGARVSSLEVASRWCVDLLVLRVLGADCFSSWYMYTGSQPLFLRLSFESPIALATPPTDHSATPPVFSFRSLATGFILGIDPDSPSQQETGH